MTLLGNGKNQQPYSWKPINLLTEVFWPPKYSRNSPSSVALEILPGFPIEQEKPLKASLQHRMLDFVTCEV